MKERDHKFGRPSASPLSMLEHIGSTPGDLATTEPGGPEHTGAQRALPGITGHCQTWPGMAGHGRAWPGMAGHCRESTRAPLGRQPRGQLYHGRRGHQRGHHEGTTPGEPRGATGCYGPGRAAASRTPYRIRCWGNLPKTGPGSHIYIPEALLTNLGLDLWDVSSRSPCEAFLQAPHPQSKIQNINEFPSNDHFFREAFQT